MLARPDGPMAWVCAVLGLAALCAAAASLWPGGHHPAWPAGTLGILALGSASFPGDIRGRALGTVCASAAIALCALELAVLRLVREVFS